tara:strand:+ start:138 stop:254 length:117 start_codon:yes stop_codon:yes gene_type:complete
MQLIEQVASDEIIEQAFSWLCLKSKEHCHNAHEKLLEA